MLQDQIRADMENAMRQKDMPVLNTLRMLIAAITHEMKAAGRMLVERMDDRDVLALIKREVKKRREAEDIYRTAQRDELATKEAVERLILEKYLPSQMAPEEVLKVVMKKKEDLGITDKKDAGILIGRVMKELGDSVDGATVKAAVDSVFQ